MKKEDITYETAFQRLEKILEEMSKPQASLELSLKLYEEADRLIAFCGETLNQAESRVASLIKNRNNELVLGEDGTPLTEDF